MATAKHPRRTFKPEMSARYGRPTFAIEKLVKYSPKHGRARIFNFPYRGSFWRPQMHTAVISVDGPCEINDASDPASQAAWSVYIGPNNPKNKCGLVPPQHIQTNSSAILVAVLNALETAQTMKKDGTFDPQFRYVELIIRLTSGYVQDTFDRDIWKWINNGYRTAGNDAVAHLGLIQQIHGMICDMEQNMTMSVRFWRTERDENAQALAQQALDHKAYGHQN